jgi:D-3-phosphoglycerate dehydrogenase
MPVKVLVAFPMTETALSKFRALPGFSVESIPVAKPETLREKIPGYDALATADTTPLTADILSTAKDLKVISLAGIGLENIDLDAATSHGIIVMNTPKAHTVTTAEHTISMLMALSRNIPQATASMKQGLWEKKRFMGTEVYNKVLGIVGLGNIGRAVAEKARAFGMRVIAIDPFVSEEISMHMGVTLVSTDILFAESDFITIHTPKTKRTENLINRDAFKKMKPGIRVINCASGGIIVEEDLLWAIDEGIVAGAALDVFDTEPPVDSPLLKNDTIILTPHLGGLTEESFEKVSLAVVEQVRGFFEDAITENAVNFPPLDPEAIFSLTPYLELGRKLGSFMGQSIEQKEMRGVEIAYFGRVSSLSVSAVTPHILKGFLREISSRKVNLVNAHIVAKESGIRVSEETSSSSMDYSSEIKMTVTTTEGTHVLIGAIVGSRARIVKVDDYFIETLPEGDILLVSNLDLPGVVGSIGSTLGSEGVNIGRMQLARDAQKERNLILINLDSPVEESTLEKLATLENVIEVKQITL